MSVLFTSFVIIESVQLVMSKRDTIVELHNSIQPGLNFLVPNHWWNEFNNLNRQTLDWSELKFPKELPLDGLREMGLVEVPQWSNQSHLKELEVRAENAAMLITEQIKNAKEGRYQNCVSQRLKQSFQVLNFEKIKQTDIKVLLCAQIVGDIKELLFDTFEWNVVTPEIYRHVCSKHPPKEQSAFGSALVGVPVFLEECTELNDSGNLTYNLGPQIYGEIFIYNTQGAKYCALGSFQQKLSYEEIMRHLYEGFNNLMDRNQYNNSYFFKRCLLLLNNTKTFENFLTDDNEEEKTFRENMKWENWFELDGSNTPSERFQIFEFGAHRKQKQVSFKRLNESKERYIGMLPSKKIKKNQPLIANYRQLKNSKGFQPATIPSISLYAYPQLKENPQILKLLKQSNVHIQFISPIKKIFIKINKPNFSIDHNRIGYNLWKGEHNVKELIKLGKEKMNDCISVPFSNDQRIDYQNGLNGKANLSRNSNKLIKNDKGEPSEQQIDKQIQTNYECLRNETAKLLEDLAHLVLGKKKDTHQMESEGDSQQQTKEAINVETQTQKRESIDEIDEVQSQNAD